MKRQKEFHGWNDWAHELQKKCQDGQLLANSYQIAAKLSYYLERHVQALNYHSRKNQFDYWRFDRELLDSKICYITDKTEFHGEEVLTPEGKRLIFVTNLKLADYQKLIKPI